MQIKVIYEDNHLLVVEKPINIPTQADVSGDTDFLNMLKVFIKEKYNKPGNVFIGMVHRLDRPVGGVMVFAKTSKAAARISEQIRAREFKKVYLAVVHGELEKSSAIIKDYLLKDSKTNIVKVVPKDAKEAKEAVLSYEVLGYLEGFSLIKVNLHTGRSHQIRVQFSNINHPLYGDQKYGEKVNKPGQQIALWSYGITLKHPVTKEELTFNSLPDMKFPWNLYNIEKEAK